MTDVTSARALDGAKKRLRRRILKQRRQAHAVWRTRGVLSNAMGLRSDWRGCRVGLFAGFGTEVDPDWLMRALTRRGAIVGLPVVVAPRMPLVFRRFQPGIRFAISGFGIREPGPRVPTMRPDIVLMPLVGVDRRGMRLGYGGGFYDRTIRDWRNRGHRPLLVGMAYETQYVPMVPTGSHDQVLDMLVTETAIRRFR
ncbi:MAG: 5-formyltetrahydrofolate cyclo-ligase [Minwuia sp.]|nr:5-formyltetrahydrofolate cyclo-ligase [Minwuia sp.]